jgi:hypothetical protein
VPLIGISIGIEGVPMKAKVPVTFVAALGEGHAKACSNVASCFAAPGAAHIGRENPHHSHEAESQYA